MLVPIYTGKFVVSFPRAAPPRRFVVGFAEGLDDGVELGCIEGCEDG